MEVRRTVDELIDGIERLTGEVEEKKISSLRDMAARAKGEQENARGMLEAVKRDLERQRDKNALLENILEAVIEAVC